MAKNKKDNKANKKNDKKETPDVIHVQIVLDRSGSMSSIAAATVDGLNGFLTKQRVVPGICRMSLADFDSEEPFRLVTDAIPLAEMRDLGPGDFEPRGATPLYDALGLAIERCDARTAADADEDQVLVIVTDGQENASTDFTGPQIAKLLKKRQASGWTVLYLGANQDGFAVGNALNLSAGNVANFEASDEGIHAAFASADQAIASYRSRDRDERRAKKDGLFDENRSR